MDNNKDKGLNLKEEMKQLESQQCLCISSHNKQQSPKGLSWKSFTRS